MKTYNNCEFCECQMFCTHEKSSHAVTDYINGKPIILKYTCSEMRQKGWPCGESAVLFKEKVVQNNILPIGSAVMINDGRKTYGTIVAYHHMANTIIYSIETETEILAVDENLITKYATER